VRRARSLSLLLAALAVALMLSPPAADAARKRVVHKRVAPPAAVAAPRGDYVEQDVRRLPFGSHAWWDQMRREGRLGGGEP
jgi:hypothetical protein